LLYEAAEAASLGGMTVPLDISRLQRSRGEGRLSLRRDAAGQTRLADLHQSGSSKIRLPKAYPPAPLTAVVLNTSGGLTGGDRYTLAVDAGAGTDAVVTTQACEKVYRAADPQTATVSTSIRVGDGATLAWLPQETILFDGGRIARSLEVDLEGEAAFIAVESYILGRTAMNETVRHGTVRDRWRIRRDGRLVHADALTVDDAFARASAGAALLAGARAFATLLATGPGAEARLAGVRAAVGETGGASACDGKLVARIAATDGLDLRTRLVEAVAALGGRPAPSIWHI